MATQEVTDSLNETVKLLAKVETNLRKSKDEVWHIKRTDNRKVRVLVRPSIITLGEIDTVRQEFSADLWFGVWYEEPELKGKKRREEVVWQDQWAPRVDLFNAVKVDKHERKYDLLIRKEDGMPIVMISNRVQATFKDKMDLRSFPFDYQNLTIRLMSNWPTSQVEFAKNMAHKDTIRTDNFVGSQQWKVYKHLLCQPGATALDQGTSQRQYPLYNVTMHVQRKMGFYVWNIALVEFLIMLLSFTAFCVPHDKPWSRLNVSLTLLLTSVAFKSVVTQNLPKISYLTLLDKYVLFCMIFQGLMVAQNALASVYTHTFDEISKAVMAVVIVLAHFLFGGYALIQICYTRTLLEGVDDEYLDLCRDIKEYYQKINSTLDSSGFTDEEARAIHTPRKNGVKRLGQGLLKENDPLFMV